MKGVEKKEKSTVLLWKKREKQYWYVNQRWHPISIENLISKSTRICFEIELNTEKKHEFITAISTIATLTVLHLL